MICSNTKSTRFLPGAFFQKKTQWVRQEVLRSILISHHSVPQKHNITILFAFEKRHHHHHHYCSASGADNRLPNTCTCHSDRFQPFLLLLVESSRACGGRRTNIRKARWWSGESTHGAAGRIPAASSATACSSGTDRGILGAGRVAARHVRERDDVRRAGASSHGGPLLLGARRRPRNLDLVPVRVLRALPVQHHGVCSSTTAPPSLSLSPPPPPSSHSSFTQCCCCCSPPAADADAVAAIVRSVALAASAASACHRWFRQSVLSPASARTARGGPTFCTADVRGGHGAPRLPRPCGGAAGATRRRRRGGQSSYSGSRCCPGRHRVLCSGSL